MASSGVKIVFGTGGVGADNRHYNSVESVHQVFEVLKKHGVDTLDTAQLYQGSEKLLGEAGATSSKWNFTVDSKAIGGWKLGRAKRQDILEGARATCKLLGLKGGDDGSLDIFYMHAPDRETPLSETCAGINDAYKEGLFKRFGLSNYSPEDVQAVYEECKKNDWVLPSVYQGNFSPVARKQEETLFPVLRKLNIAFYAYSPIAGGFLTKTRDEIQAGKGRFDTSTPLGKMYAGLYSKPSYLEALGKWDQIAKDNDLERAEMAYRWVTFNSLLTKQHGDACIIGARHIGQLDETLTWLDKGPLTDATCQKINELWKGIEHEAPTDNYEFSL